MLREIKGCEECCYPVVKIPSENPQLWCCIKGTSLANRFQQAATVDYTRIWSGTALMRSFHRPKNGDAINLVDRKLEWVM